MRRSSALHLAAYRDASRRYAKWAREKMAEFHAADADVDQDSPLWMYGLLAFILSLGTGVVIAVLCKLV